MEDLSYRVPSKHTYCAKVRGVKRERKGREGRISEGVYRGSSLLAACSSCVSMCVCVCVCV